MKFQRGFFIVLAILAISLLACSLTEAKTVSPDQVNAATQAPAVPAAPAAENTAPPSATSSPVEKIERADGWLVYTLANEGFVVAIPPKWGKIDMDPETMKSSLEAVSEKNPAFAKVLSEQIQSMAAQGIKFYGMDLSTEALGSGFANNVNVLRQDLNADLTLDLVRQVNVGQLENMENVIKPVNNTIVDLPAGKAVKLTYQMSIATADGNPIKVNIVQYMFLKERQLFVVTAGASESMAAQYLAAFDQIGQEFQILP